MSEQEENSPPKQKTPTIQQKIDLAVHHHNAGRLPEAESIYQDVLRTYPDQPVAMHLLGVIAYQAGKNDEAVDLITKALAINPNYAEAHFRLGKVLKELVRLDDAVFHYQKAIEITPDFFEAHNNLGNTLYEIGRLDEAVLHFQIAIEINPKSAVVYNNLGNSFKKMGRPEEAISNYRKAVYIEYSYADAHSNLGNILGETGKFKEAVVHCQKAIDLNPMHIEAHNNLGNSLRKLGQLNEAVASYNKAIDLNPESAVALSNLGNALRELGQPEEAVAHYCKAIDINQKYAQAHSNLGHVQNELGRYDEAQAAYDKGFQLSHGGPWWNSATYADGDRLGSGPPAEAIFTSPFKLQNSVDQLDYLISKGRIDPSFRRLVDGYRKVLAEIQLRENPELVTELTRDQLGDIGSSYDRVIYCSEAPPIRTGTINTGLDFKNIEDHYFSSPVSVTTLDDFLTPKALRGLREFCLESTIFFGYTGNHFVDSYVSRGFSCGLLFQIAEEVKQCFPRILGDHYLSNMWVYRYNNQSEGVAAHTDDGAVTFNLWITPGDANLDPDSGGLIVYTKEQPHDWDWGYHNRMKYNATVKEKIADFLTDADTVTIPHRENRSTLFHSNLFHKSDRIHFRDGYENRRVNITFLFGKREV